MSWFPHVLSSRLPAALLAAWVGWILFSSSDLAIDWAHGVYEALLGAVDSPPKIEVRTFAQKAYHVLLSLS